MGLLLGNVVKLLGYLSVLLVVGGNRNTPCKLVWRATHFLVSIPEDAIASHEGQYFIGRGVVPPFPYPSSRFPAHGWIKNSTRAVDRIGRFYNTLRDEVSVFHFYEILTNPNDCFVQWVYPEEAGGIPKDLLKFVTYIFKDGAVVKFRDEETQLPAAYTKSKELAIGVNAAGQKTERGIGQVLVSYINLRMELDKFVFTEEVDSGDVDGFGLDVIINESEVEVNQTVFHRKSILERYSFQESESFSSVKECKVGMDIPIQIGHWNVGFEFGYNNLNVQESSSSLKIEHEEEKEMISKRKIVVPPFTSVEACSFVNFKDSAVLNYVAEARYTVKGFSAARTLSIVREAGIPNILRMEGTSVISKVNGSMRVSIPTKTSFRVTSLGDPKGCSGMLKTISKNRREKFFSK